MNQEWQSIRAFLTSAEQADNDLGICMIPKSVCNCPELITLDNLVADYLDLFPNEYYYYINVMRAYQNLRNGVIKRFYAQEVCFFFNSVNVCEDFIDTGVNSTVFYNFINRLDMHLKYKFRRLDKSSVNINASKCRDVQGTFDVSHLEDVNELVVDLRNSNVSLTGRFKDVHYIKLIGDGIVDNNVLPRKSTNLFIADTGIRSLPLDLTCEYLKMTATPGVKINLSPERIETALINFDGKVADLDILNSKEAPIKYLILKNAIIENLSDLLYLATDCLQLHECEIRCLGQFPEQVGLQLVFENCVYRGNEPEVQLGYNCTSNFVWDSLYQLPIRLIPSEMNGSFETTLNRLDLLKYFPKSANYVAIDIFCGSIDKINKACPLVLEFGDQDVDDNFFWYDENGELVIGSHETLEDLISNYLNENNFNEFTIGCGELPYTNWDDDY